MGEREKLEDNIKRMTAELADMKATLETLPKENRIAVFKGDYVLAETKGVFTRRQRVFLVLDASPLRATLQCVSNAGNSRIGVVLDHNSTINGDSRADYKFIKVISKDQAMSLI